MLSSMGYLPTPDYVPQMTVHELDANCTENGILISEENRLQVVLMKLNHFLSK